MIQYRIRPVTRYVITRYEEITDDKGRDLCGSSSERGQYENAKIAFEVAYALCKAEHDASGLPLDSKEFRYPKHEDAFPDMERVMTDAPAPIQGVQGLTAKEALGI